MTTIEALRLKTDTQQLKGSNLSLRTLKSLWILMFIAEHLPA